MGRFCKVSGDQIKSMVFGSGMLLRRFDPENPDIRDGDVLCATKWGVQIRCIPVYIDFGVDMDDCIKGCAENMEIDYYKTSVRFTALTHTPTFLKQIIGNYLGFDSVGSANVYFSDIWWVGVRQDGLFAAIKLHHALSKSGFRMKTGSGRKGVLTVEFSGQITEENMDLVPMTFYIEKAKEEPPVIPEEVRIPTICGEFICGNALVGFTVKGGKDG